MVGKMREQIPKTEVGTIDNGIKTDEIKKEELNELALYFDSIRLNKPLDCLSQFICPHLVGSEWMDIRKATLLMLLTQNDSVTRMRLHVLLVGSAGTGKTEKLLWWRENLDAVMINGELASKTGLVGDARGNRVTPGLLADYDGNVVCIDELDKMNTRDQSGLLQAMEEGQYIIVKGKHRQPFRAEVRVIGACNELGLIQRPLLDRFDFIYFCTTASREERAEQTPRIVDSFFGKEQDEYKIVKKYVQWLGDFNPIIMPEDRIDVVDTIQKYILNAKEVEIEKVSYRSLEMSILRAAWAMAKLQKKNINKQDVIEAIIFKDRVLRKLYKVKYGKQ